MSIMRDFNMVAQIDTFGESFNVKSLKVEIFITAKFQYWTAAELRVT